MGSDKSRSISKLRAREIVQKVTVESPCSVGWETMDGDEKVRFCGQCKLNVYNISAMSETEAAGVLTRAGGRPCVFLRRQEDGTVVSDNCPVALRSMRKRMARSAMVGLLTLTYGLALYTQSQNIAVPGLAVNPLYGHSSEMGQLADYGYDRARDISRMVTALAFFICLFVPMDKRITVKRGLVELILLACVPLLVHMIGTFFINNFGGLGGGM